MNIKYSVLVMAKLTTNEHKTINERLVGEVKLKSIDLITVGGIYSGVRVN